MSNYLDTLRSKPKETRAYVALVTATICTGLLFIVWIVGVPERIAVPSNNPSVAAVQQQNEVFEKEDVETGTMKRIFGQLKRGMTAVIFNDTQDAATPAEPAVTKEIDIDALLRQPVRPKTTEPATVMASTTQKNSDMEAGTVILIGTTTNARNPEKDE